MPLLSIANFLPLLGALFVLVARGNRESLARTARVIALGTTVANLVVALIIWSRFDYATHRFQFVEETAWLGSGITYRVGVDGISMLFVVLTAGLMPFCILASWESVNERVPEYMVAFLLLETMMIGVFTSLNLVLFYVFFEGGLIPMFLIIGVWGGPRRVYASFKFFLYTLLGSLLMLLAILSMYFQTGTTDIQTLINTVAFLAGHADLAVARFLRVLRRQDADVARTYMAARRPCRSAHSGVRDSRRHAAEDGRLRLSALLAAHDAECVGDVRAAGLCAFRRCA